MKKMVLTLALVLVGSFVFASNDKLVEQKEEKILKIQAENETEFNEELSNDLCTASCYAEISYNGRYVTTVYETSSAGDCVTAQSNCLAAVRKKAQVFIDANS